MKARALAALASLSLTAAAPQPAIQYRLSVLTQPAAPAVAEVEMRFTGDADGETRLRLPAEFGGAAELWKYVGDIRVTGAQVSQDGPATRVLRHRPGAPIVVRYRLRTAYGEDPKSGTNNPYDGPILRPAWFALLGDDVFAWPEGRDQAPATFAWGVTPAGWTRASDVENAPASHPLNVNEVVGSISVGGAGWRLVTRPVPGGEMRLAIPGDSELLKGSLADDLARVVSVQRAFWDDMRAPFTVALVPLARNERTSSWGGTGRSRGFTLYADPNFTSAPLVQLIAHEHMHSWIPHRTAKVAEGPQEPAGYWFSEGFTDFYAMRTLVRGGVWTPREFFEAMNAELQTYDLSPVRTAPNSRIVEAFWKEPAVERLPYVRGFTVALKWDDDIRRATGGRLGLDAVMLRMRDRFHAAPAADAPLILDNLVTSAREVAGVDLRPDIARYAEAGEAIPLPGALFAGCVAVATTSQPRFDPGFDQEKTEASNVATGVRPGGPAYAAGLREGMKIVGWDFYHDDPTHQLGLVVLDDAGKRIPFRYWPHSQQKVEVRSLDFASGLSDDARAQCVRRLGGA